MKPGLVALYDVHPGNRLGLLLQPEACMVHKMREHITYYQ